MTKTNPSPSAIVRMSNEHLAFFGQANEPFQVIGKVLPHFENGLWSWTEEIYPKAKEKQYPMEHLDWTNYIGNPRKAVYMCFDEDVCVGQIRLGTNWNHYCLIEDIAVRSDHRGQGLGRQLIEQARIWALEQDLGGLCLETQDNNLVACRFYQRYGFALGGVDIMLYRNTEHGGEFALFWYLKFEAYDDSMLDLVLNSGNLEKYTAACFPIRCKMA